MAKRKGVLQQKEIFVAGAKEHNLKNLEVSIPRDQLVVMTGLSGSGKSSLAFDTIFAEGQRKYMESLSSYARQFLNQMHKPNVERIEGLPPTIAIEQRAAAHNPRSTVATTTEIYDYLRLLFSRCGSPSCWYKEKEEDDYCGRPIEEQSASQIIKTLKSLPEGRRLTLMAPLVIGKKGYHRDLIEDLQNQGYIRLRVDGKLVDLSEGIDMDSENPLEIERYVKHDIEVVVSRLIVKKENNKKLSDSIETTLKLGKGVVLALIENEGKEEELTFSEDFACAKHPHCSLKELEPRLFSFNSPFGACKECNGLGLSQEFDREKILDPSLSIVGGAFVAFKKLGYLYQRYYQRLLNKVCRKLSIDNRLPFSKLPIKQQEILLHGVEKMGRFEFAGVIPLLMQRLEETENDRVRERLLAFQRNTPCSGCGGGRLRKEASHVFITSKDKEKKNIVELSRMNVSDAEEFIRKIVLSKEQKKIAEPILREIASRLGFLRSVGLGYLNLNRKTSTLSGGEAQRIRLATQVGTGLVGVCYVLDEPTIGLHQRDNARLIDTLRHLVDIGNSVIVVEHDEEMMRAADHIIDIGPGPGVHGGTIVAEGSYAKIIKNKKSLTGKFLSGKEEIAIPKKRRPLCLKKALKIEKAKKHNLKNISVEIPLGGLVCVTGVSGSGKSTLVNDILLETLTSVLSKKQKILSKERAVSGIEQITRVIAVDQSPIGKTPRSNPATYTGVFDEIRSLFSKSKEANSRGYPPGRFSFNVKGGRCEECQGQGTKKIEMHFLPDVFVECESCLGNRYNRETLEVFYREKNIADILAMTVEEGLEFFSAHRKIQRMLDCLHRVGLDYIQLGQASNTLSGGEAQRVKLASELGRVTNTRGNRQHTVYILDEPTTGLHFADIRKVLSVLHALVEAGNTVIVIEHNLDVIKCADWIIDLGPEGGQAGGELIAAGTPEEVAKKKKSYTGQFLKPLL